MEYAVLGRSGLNVSKIGIGGEWLNGLDKEETSEIISDAIARGINFIDIFMPQPETRSNIGYAIKNIRDKVVIQGHLGTVFENGQYCRTRDLAKTKKSFEDLLDRLATDYIDIGMIHYIDTYEDYRKVFESPIIDYIKELKKNGTIKYIGMSSHNPSVSIRAVESGMIDVLMFSINPAYDMENSNTKYEDLRKFNGFADEGWIVDPIRQKLYSICESLGVSITVMKALASGSLLNEDLSPFGVKLTVPQCIHYCFTRPGVKSVFIGFHSLDQVKTAVDYFESSEEEKSFSKIFEENKKIMITGRCMYCNHCLPCPSHIDIASVNKFLDLAVVKTEVPETVNSHYMSLDRHGEDCIQCGKCEPNCPFGVEIIERMKLATAIFGK
jgi:predicted aldo/keto reductase-like oxidoreductase